MKFIPAVSEASIVKIPLFTERCPAGFPSPAADYTESELDLNEYCIHRRHLWGGDRLCMDGTSPRKQREALRDKA